MRGFSQTSRNPGLSSLVDQCGPEELHACGWDLLPRNSLTVGVTWLGSSAVETL